MLPLVYSGLNTKSTVLLYMALGFLLISLVFKLYIKIKVEVFGLILAFVLMLVFDLLEKNNPLLFLNFSYHDGKEIPILLSAAILTNLAIVLSEKKLSLPGHVFAKYFLFSCLFLFVIALVFFTILSLHYELERESDLKLLNNIFKYLCILWLATNYTLNQKKVVRLSWAMCISLSLLLISQIVF
jgi:hypothetical protein